MTRPIPTPNPGPNPGPKSVFCLLCYCCHSFCIFVFQPLTKFVEIGHTHTRTGAHAQAHMHRHARARTHTHTHRMSANISPDQLFFALITTEKKAGNKVKRKKKKNGATIILFQDGGKLIYCSGSGRLTRVYCNGRRVQYHPDGTRTVVCNHARAYININIVGLKGTIPCMSSFKRISTDRPHSNPKKKSRSQSKK